MSIRQTAMALVLGLAISGPARAEFVMKIFGEEIVGSVGYFNGQAMLTPCVGLPIALPEGADLTWTTTRTCGVTFGSQQAGEASGAASPEVKYRGTGDVPDETPLIRINCGTRPENAPRPNYNMEAYLGYMRTNGSSGELWRQLEADTDGTRLEFEFTDPGGLTLTGVVARSEYDDLMRRLLPGQNGDCPQRGSNPNPNMNMEPLFEIWRDRLPGLLGPMADGGALQPLDLVPQLQSDANFQGVRPDVLERMLSDSLRLEWGNISAAKVFALPTK